MMQILGLYERSRTRAVLSGTQCRAYDTMAEVTTVLLLDWYLSATRALGPKVLIIST